MKGQSWKIRARYALAEAVLSVLAFLVGEHALACGFAFLAGIDAGEARTLRECEV